MQRDLELGGARRLPSLVRSEFGVARPQPRPTTNGRFMGSGLVLSDLLGGHEPESAGKPAHSPAGAGLRAKRVGWSHREACGVRGFTPAFRTRFMEKDEAGEAPSA